MPTLLMRLAGPMQSWGIGSRFTIRDTCREPSKSGVVGILCASLGKPRFESADDGFPSLAQIAALRLGVRVDREGTLVSDYQTAGGGDWMDRPYGVYKADGKSGDSLLSTRYYLSGAHFLVGLEGSVDLLRILDTAIRNPVWQLGLGRKSFLPSIPLQLPDAAPDGPGLREETLEDALLAVPLGHPLEPRPLHEDLDRIRLVIEDPGSHTGLETRFDVPIDFGKRKFSTRTVLTRFESVGKVAHL
jgi:CRISPR system Cascade subunit CasD